MFHLSPAGRTFTLGVWQSGGQASPPSHRSGLRSAVITPDSTSRHGWLRRRWGSRVTAGYGGVGWSSRCGCLGYPASRRSWRSASHR